VRPSIDLNNQIKKYRDEYLKNNEKRINGCCGLIHYNDINEWLKIENEVRTNKLTEKNVLADSYFLYRLLDDKIIGSIQIRHSLNEDLKSYGGHIGYSISPLERKKGYGTLMLSLVLEKAKTLGINKVLITCDKDNIASRKIIITNGRILENEIIFHESIIQRFWITLK